MLVATHVVAEGDLGVADEEKFGDPFPGREEEEVREACPRLLCFGQLS